MGHRRTLIGVPGGESKVYRLMSVHSRRVFGTGGISFLLRPSGETTV